MEYEIMVDKMDLIWGLLTMGFTIAMVVIVITAGIRIGWKLAPWILAIGFLSYLFF